MISAAAVPSLFVLLFSAAVFAQQPQLVVQTGHTARVKSVDISPDGHQVISGSVDGTAKLWDTDTGRELRTFAAGTSSTSHVDEVRFEPSGQTILTLAGGKIAVWNAMTGTQIRALPIEGHVECFALSPDGKQLVLTVSTAQVKLYDFASSIYIRDLVHPSHYVWERIDAFAFSPDGRFIAGASQDKTIRLWDAATGGELRPPLTGHNNAVSAVGFSPDSRILASAGSDGTVRIWDFSSGAEEVPPIRVPGVQTLAFASTGVLMTGERSGTVRAWNAKSGSELWHNDERPGGLERSVNSIAANGDQVATGGDDSAVTVLDLKTGRILATLDTKASVVRSVAISPDGRYLITGGADGNTRIFDMETNTLRVIEGSTFKDISATGRDFVTLANVIQIRDVSTGEIIKSIDPGLRNGIPNSVTFTPDGKRLITSNEDSTIKLWDIATASFLRTLFAGSHMASEAGNNVEYAALSPDQRLLATATSNGKLAVYDAAKLTQLRTLEGRVNVSRVMFSPDGSEIVAGAYYNRSLKFWSTVTGKEVTHAVVPAWTRLNGGAFAYGKMQALQIKAESNEGKVSLLDTKTLKEFADVIALGVDEWVVVAPDGRFDTNKPLDNIDGIHWVLPDSPMTPRPLELFMRQYFEPGLFRRALSGQANSKEFRPLPSIQTMNLARGVVRLRVAEMSHGR